MHISLVGINHQTAPIDVREKIAINRDQIVEALAALLTFMPAGVIVSTCHRTEIYSVGEGEAPEKASLSFLQTRLRMPPEILASYTFKMRDGAALRHLFRVTCGLESMALGEYEVLGQVRQSFEAAEAAGAVSLPLRNIFNAAVRTGRLVREITGISKNPVSVSSLAISLAENILGDLAHCKMLVVGTGEAGSLAAKVAREKGASRIAIVSRTLERASAMAEALGGVPCTMDCLAEELAKTDLVVTCAGAPHALLGVVEIMQVMKQRPETPLVIMDIAVPRNVEPEVRQVKNVHIYDLDNLMEISRRNSQQREGSVAQAENIIDEELAKVLGWWHSFEIRPVVGALMSKAEDIRAAQLKKTLKKLPSLTDEQRESLDAMTKSIVNRILQSPVEYLKTNGNGSQAEMVKELFELNTGDKE